MDAQAEEHTHPLEAHQDGEDGESDEDSEDGDGQDYGDLTAHPVNADTFDIFPEKYIFFARNRTWSEKDTEHYKNILETFVNIQRVPGKMHA